MRIQEVSSRRFRDAYTMRFGYILLVLYNNSLLILLITSFKVNIVLFQIIGTYQASDESHSATNDSTILYYKHTLLHIEKIHSFLSLKQQLGQKYARAKVFHVLISKFVSVKQGQNFANTNIITCVLWLIQFYQICGSYSVGVIEQVLRSVGRQCFLYFDNFFEFIFFSPEIEAFYLF